AHARDRAADRLQAVGVRDRAQRVHRSVPARPARRGGVLRRQRRPAGRRPPPARDARRLARRRVRRQAAPRPPVRGLGGLSETHHQILVLRELEGLSYREIGERLGMSRPAVESTLFRARRRLTEEYDELVTGRRCQRVQSIIATAAEGMLGARDERRLARHLSYCQSCRREARLAGVEAGRPRTTVAAKLAALF